MVRVLEGIRSGGNPPCQGSNIYFYLVLLEEGWACIQNTSARPAVPSEGIRQGKCPNMPRISEMEDEGGNPTPATKNTKYYKLAAHQELLLVWVFSVGQCS